MNKKAERFQAYLQERDKDAFHMEEVKEGEQEAVIFQSFLAVEGQQLPLLVILDNSVFAVVRVQLAPKALREENKLALLQLASAENFKYKPFKLYFDEQGNLLLDSFLLVKEDDLKGEDLYLLFEVMANYLKESYRTIMKAVWE